MTELRKRRERLVADLEGDEDTVGDRGDAADEIQLAEELGFVDRRISELEATLQGGASVPNAAGLLPDGAEVTVKFPDGQVATMRVISVVEQIPADEVKETLTTLTADSPLGLALAGHQPGDVVSYVTPHGQEQVELLAIRLPA